MENVSHLIMIVFEYNKSEHFYVVPRVFLVLFYVLYLINILLHKNEVYSKSLI